MGEDRNQIIAQLIALAQEADITWPDSLPISGSAPWHYTKADHRFFRQSTDEDGAVVITATYLGALARNYRWPGNPDLSQDELRSICKKLGLLQQNSDPITKEMEAAADLLYAEVNLSAKELLTAMCKSFGLVDKHDDESVITGEMRATAGVLYEVYLRSSSIVYNDYLFAQDVDISFISKVKEHSLTGVSIETATTRQYNTSSAAHVLGRVAAIAPEDWPTYRELGYPMNATVGKGGVELAFESYLHGTSGVREIETDENGKIITQEWITEPGPGDNVVLTLDSNLQATTEDLLAQFVTQLETPDGAAGVVVDMTGGVLALASYPTYNLATYAEDYAQLSQSEVSPYYNRATHGTYAPGSTFKMVTATAALSEGVITPRDTVICTGQYMHYAYANHTPKCWIYPGNHASENVSEAIKDSCNIFFYDVGRRTGIEAIVEYATKFGLGQHTGIEIGEYKGTVASPETSAANGVQWYGGDITSASIGQGNNKFTPVQLANYIATLVNGGNHYEVHLLKEIKSNDYSQVLHEYQPILKDSIDIDPAHLAAIKKGMYDLSKTASMAQYFSSLPVEVGCKTGTAEVAGKEPTAVFVCFAPYDDPQVAICLVAEQGASGGNLASVAAGILAQYFSTDSSLSAPTGENNLLH
jgi:penicillin-binding protein 2